MPLSLWVCLKKERFGALFLFLMNMSIVVRLKKSIRPAAIHLAGGLVIACVLAVFIFAFWYPWPYDEFSGGRSLFVLLICVDVICGPLLTLLLVTESKSRKLLILDISLVLLIQISAMAYGLLTVWQARPLYLVAEIDRFKVITVGELSIKDIKRLPPTLQMGVLDRPKIVGVRPPISLEEKNKVLFESLSGGRDYAERPEFYVPYDALMARKLLKASRPLEIFIQKNPIFSNWARNYSDGINVPIGQIRYIPVIARQDWIAVLDGNGFPVEFVKGDGFQ